MGRRSHAATRELLQNKCPHVTILVLALIGVGHGQWSQDDKLTAADGAGQDAFELPTPGDWLGATNPACGSRSGDTSILSQLFP